MKTKEWILVAAMAVGLPETGFGQTGEVQEPDRVVYRRETRIDYGEVALEGEIKKPGGSFVSPRTRARFASLVKVRSDFVPELERSADEL